MGITHRKLELKAIERANSLLETLEAARGKKYEGSTRLMLKGLAQNEILKALEEIWEPDSLSKPFILFCDGSGTTKPNPGGWCAIWLAPEAGHGEDEEWLNRGFLSSWTGHIPQATSQLAELTAIMEGLKRVEPGTSVEIRTDSECCVRWFTPRKTPDGQPIYKDGILQTVYQRSDPFVHALCHQIEEVIAQQQVEVTFRHVRGHGKDPDEFNRYWNHIVDKWAGKARTGA